jgi:two-component system OmpR family sensor kinase
MRRRIAITILLTVLTAIVCAGAAAWFAARAVLLAELDQSIIGRAMSLPSVSGKDRSEIIQPGDRFIVQGGLGQTLGRPMPASGAAPVYQVTDAAFIRLPEGSYRRLTLRLPAEGLQAPTTIVYSGPAAEFDRVLRRLALMLIACGAAGAGIAAAVAARLARLALRPLDEAAAAIGTVNETNLDRRVDQNFLPPELRPMARQLNRMLGRLQTAFEQRRRFVADASHELRTPTAAMITIMEVALRRPRSSAELQDALSICLNEARHMRQLVQALLRQVRADGESAAEEVSDFDASELVTQCANLAQSLAKEKQILLVGDVSGALPVRTEASRLRSVVMNLLSNAIEYNKSGGSVEVSARLQGTSAEIRVKDDGPGISPEDLPNLFQPFYRAGKTRQSDGHLGLGLFLVESHVKAMGGECRVESQLGHGTTFCVRMPLAPQAAGPAAGPRAEWKA